MSMHRTFLILFLLIPTAHLQSKQKEKLVVGTQAQSALPVKQTKAQETAKPAKESLYCLHTWYRCPQFYWQIAAACTTGVIIGTICMLCGASPHLGITPSVQYQGCSCSKTNKKKPLQ